MSETLNGLIIRDQSGFYWAETADGSIYKCELRGRLKEEAQASDIAAIGDRVTITIREEDGAEVRNGVIEEITERKNVLSRAARTSGKRGAGQAQREHVIIANTDQLFLVFAAAQPAPNLRMLDYLLVAAEKSNIEDIIIIVNKIDLMPVAATAAIFLPYSRMGYEILYTSALEKIGVDQLQARLCDKISVLSGPSGVGKTSLLNCIEPGLGRAVKAISDHTGEGIHTTRDSALIKLKSGGYLADTPGIRTLMVWDIEPDELDAYFVDIAPYVGSCKFNDCAHTNEPGCAVREAVAKEEISRHRYENYLKLREELRETYIVYDP